MRSSSPSRIRGTFLFNENKEFIIATGVFGLITQSCYIFLKDHEWFTIFEAGIVSLAAAAIGGFFGFLFGIPRQIFSTDAIRDEVRPSTNLQEVSDWITKILLGVGLIELTKIGLQFQELVNLFSMETDIKSTIFWGCVVLLYLVLGFCLSFFWTRTDYFEMERETRQDIRETVQHLEDDLPKVWSALLALERGLPGTLQRYADSLDEILKRSPSNREAAMVRARYAKNIFPDREGLPKSIEILTTFINHKDNAIPPIHDTDYADALYNRACYSILKAASAEKPEKDKYISDGFDDLRKAILFNPLNKLDAQHDGDFASVRDDARFRNLVGVMA